MFSESTEALGKWGPGPRKIKVKLILGQLLGSKGGMITVPDICSSHIEKEAPGPSPEFFEI